MYITQDFYELCGQVISVVPRDSEHACGEPRLVARNSPIFFDLCASLDADLGAGSYMPPSVNFVVHESYHSSAVDDPELGRINFSNSRDNGSGSPERRLCSLRNSDSG
jgi:hypothetical protein